MMTTWDRTHDAPKAASAGMAVGMLLLAALFWGSGNVASKTVLLDLDPLTVVVLRHLIALGALLPFALRERGAPMQLCAWLQSVLPACLFYAGAVIAQQVGYQTASVTNASFLVNSACVLTAVVAVVVFGERLQLPVALAAVLTLVGALLMSGDTLGWAGFSPGDLLCLVSACLYAGWTVTAGRHIRRHARPFAATMAQCAAAACVAAPFAFAADPGLVRNWAGALPELSYLGLASTAAAIALTSAAQRVISASVTAILVSAESLFGAAGGVIWLGERPGPSAIVGAAVMTLAILLVFWPTRRRPLHPPEISAAPDI